MSPTRNSRPAGNEAASGETIGCRYPPHLVHLLDAVKRQRGDESRADTIRHALDCLLEEWYPGSTGGAERAEPATAEGAA